MSKALRSMSTEARNSAIQRRLKSSSKSPTTGKQVGGLGYWGAVDAQSKRKKGVK